jgi:hypothetical protein
VKRTLTVVILVAAVLIPGMAVAYPPAVLTSDDDSITVAGLDCGTTYEIRVRERRSGSWRDQQTYTKATAACATPTPTPTPTPTATATPSPTATPTPSATPSPTPTATPTVTPTPEPTPAPEPGAFPDESSTGPSGTLTAYSGPNPITTSGTVIDSKMIGCIAIRAANVTIRNSRVSCSGGYAVYVEDTTAVYGVRIEDSEINCGNTNGTGVGEAHATVVRTEITGCENGLDVNQDVTVQDSLIHELYTSATAHSDGYPVRRRALGERWLGRRGA